jgi:hypothetical protein
MVSVERAGGMHRRLTHRCPTHQCLAPTWHQPGTNLVGDRERRSDGTASDVGTEDLLPRAWLKPGCTAVGARHRADGRRAHGLVREDRGSIRAPLYPAAILRPPSVEMLSGPAGPLYPNGPARESARADPAVP